MAEEKINVPVKCMKCEMEIKTIFLEDEDEPKKGEYANYVPSGGCGCVEEGKAPGILVEIINPAMECFFEESGTFHGYLCDGCLQELRDKKIIEDGPEEDKEDLIYGTLNDEKVLT